MENINIKAETGMTIQNAENIKLKNVNIDVQQGPPFILKNADVKELEQTNN
jgi:hypothetical protein